MELSQLCDVIVSSSSCQGEGDGERTFTCIVNEVDC